MKVSDYITEFLIEKNIDKVFGYIGGNNAHVFDSIDKYKEIELVNSRHEQGAGFAAEGYARVTLKTGVTSVTSGPGGTNLMTPISSCYLDSVPSLFIIGDINSFERDPLNGRRQIGFQDVDLVSMAKPITKYAVFVADIRNLRYELEKAYYLTQEGRKGPVLISIPVDLQYQKDYEPKNESSFFNSSEYKALSEISSVKDQDIEKVKTWISASKRPVFLVGNGVSLSGSKKELRTFLNKNNIPIVHSLMGKDAVTSNYPYNLGFIGRWGNRYGNLTLANADLIIALGSRIDTLQTGRNTDEFGKNTIVVQVDIDKHELGSRIPVDLEILGDVKQFLEALSKKDIELNIEPWKEKVLAYKQAYPHAYTLDKKPKFGNQVISLISKYSKKGDTFTVDVGEHQMLSAQALEVFEEQKVLFTGGLGSMGFSLPAAIGATLGSKKRAIVISGDGGMQMNIQELEVIKSRNLAVKIFILNNACLHMVTGMQDAFLDSNYIGTKEDYSAPDFKKVGEAYGIKSHQVLGLKELEEVLKESMNNDDCEIIEIKLEREEMVVSPLLDYSRPFEDMLPYLEREELKEQMMTKEQQEKYNGK